jgi:hypothetical protein
MRGLLGPFPRGDDTAVSVAQSESVACVSSIFGVRRTCRFLEF